MKKIWKYFLLVTPVLLFGFVLFQNPGMIRLSENLDYMTSSYPQEKIYVHTDKPYYSLGDDMWYAVYLTNASDHGGLPVSGLVYVVLENEVGEIVSEGNIEMNGKFGHGDFELDREWLEGEYTLKAFTNYMRNYSPNYIFSKKIAIWGKSDTESSTSSINLEKQKAKARFFPEGGNLIAGLNTKIAFELSDTIPIEIEVFDSSGDVVAKGKTTHKGIGYVSILPKTGETYSTKYKGKSFKLPRVKASGANIVVNNLNADYIYIDILSTPDVDLADMFIIGHLRGIIFLQQDGFSGNAAKLKIDKSALPDGVAQFTLFNKEELPIAERTVFLQHQNNAVNVSSKIPFQYLNTRQKADMSFSISDATNKPLEGDFSLSILDANKVSMPKGGVNIKSYLLLKSEFARDIDNPNFYFTDDSKKLRFMLDLQMMTKGWTRYKWEDISKKQEPYIQYPPENGFTISGYVYERGNPVKARIDFSVIGEGFVGQIIETEADGSFRISGIPIPSTSNIFLKAGIPGGPGEDLKTDNIRIIINKTTTDKIESKNPISYLGISKEEATEYIRTSYKEQTLDSVYNGIMSVEIETISIKAKDKSIDQQLRQERNIPYMNYDKRLFMDSIRSFGPYRTVFDIVTDEVAGVKVVGQRGINQRFRIRGGSNSITGNLDAKVLIDGVESSYEMLNALPTNLIEFVDVLRGLSSAGIYNAPNGVIAIYTRRGGSLIDQIYSRPDYIATIEHAGYTQAREFYSPDYSVSFPGAERPDLRTTLYWNPRITTTNGNATVSFHTADQITKYIVEVQGLTENGIPFVNYGELEVR